MANTFGGSAGLISEVRLRESASGTAPGRAARLVYGQLWTADTFNNPGATDIALHGHPVDYRQGNAGWIGLFSPVISPTDFAETSALEGQLLSKLNQPQRSTGYLSLTFTMESGNAQKLSAHFRMPDAQLEYSFGHLTNAGYTLSVENRTVDNLYRIELFFDGAPAAIRSKTVTGALGSGWHHLEIYFGDDGIIAGIDRPSSSGNMLVANDFQIGRSEDAFVGMGITGGIAAPKTRVKEFFLSEYPSDPYGFDLATAVPGWAPNGIRKKFSESLVRAGDPLPSLVRWTAFGSFTSLPPTEVFTGLRQDDGSVAAAGLTGSWAAAANDVGFIRAPSTWHATSTGGQGGATRTGSLRMEAGLRRLSSPPLATDWTAYSEQTAPSPAPAGFEQDRWRGVINPRTQISSVVIEPAGRGSQTLPYEVPTVVTIRATLADVPWNLTDTPTVELVSLDVTRFSAQGSAWGTDRESSASDTVDNTYPKGLQGVGFRISATTLDAVQYDSRSRLVFDAAPAGFRIADAVAGATQARGRMIESSSSGSAFTQNGFYIYPGIVVTPIFQIDDNTFHPTDVFFKHNPALTRDVAQRAFITYVLTTPSGVGLNGITAERFAQDQSLAQEAAEVGSVATTVTVSGQAGVIPTFQTHRTTNPVGLWRAWLNIIAPANLIDLELDDDFLFIVRSRSTDVVSVVNFSNADPTLDGTHYIPGEDMLVTAFLLNTVTRKPLPLDAGATPAVAIMRFNPGSGRLEYLGPSLSWVAVVEGAGNETAYGHAMTPNATDSRIKQVVLPGYVFDFKDVFVIPTGLVYNGTDYTLPLEREIVDSTIRHDVPAGTLVGQVSAKLATGVRGQARRAVASGSVDQETVKGKVKTTVKGRVS